MDKYSEIIKELNTLPKGYISKKKINGRQYSYLQYPQNGKLHSAYVSEAEVSGYKTAIERRKALEAELSKYLKLGKNIPVPSKRSRELTGSLMMEDIEVARFEKGQMLYIDEKKAPLFIKRTHNISEYLASRAIDRGRTNSRILKKALGITESKDDMVALYSYGASLTDNYWFRAKGSKLKYKDIAFEYDFYSDIALKGEILLFPKSPKLSPQLNLTGSYEKAWKRIGEEWWLYKQGTEDERFSEVYCSKLADKIGIPTVKYELANGYVRVKNFASKYNFEPMISIAGDDDSYNNVFNALIQLDESFAKDYLKLIWFDTLVNNVDRHNENCGLLRDKHSGAIIGLAPNFDNNLALISRSDVLNLNPKLDGFYSYFVKFIKSNKKAHEFYSAMDLPKIDEAILQKCFNEIPMLRDEIQIKKYLMNRYEALISIKSSG